jgi:hypothetical protein
MLPTPERRFNNRICERRFKNPNHQQLFKIRIISDDRAHSSGEQVQSKENCCNIVSPADVSNVASPDSDEEAIFFECRSPDVDSDSESDSEYVEDVKVVNGGRNYSAISKRWWDEHNASLKTWRKVISNSCQT